MQSVEISFYSYGNENDYNDLDNYIISYRNILYKTTKLLCLHPLCFNKILKRKRTKEKKGGAYKRYTATLIVSAYHRTKEVTYSVFKLIIFFKWLHHFALLLSVPLFSWVCSQLIDE